MGMAVNGGEESRREDSIDLDQRVQNLRERKPGASSEAAQHKLMVAGRQLVTVLVCTQLCVDPIWLNNIYLDFDS